jgi:hypothetical protein
MTATFKELKEFRYKNHTKDISRLWDGKILLLYSIWSSKIISSLAYMMTSRGKSAISFLGIFPLS